MSCRRALWGMVSRIARRTTDMEQHLFCTQTRLDSLYSEIRWKSSLPEDISAAARQARFARKWNAPATTSQQHEDSHEDADTKTATTETPDIVSSFMFPWEKRQMQGGALSTWEKYYWGVFVVSIAVFLFSRAGHWMSKDPNKEEEECRRKEEVEKQKQEKARRVLIGGSMLEDEEDPFDGLSPEEIEEYVQQATGANMKDPFEGMSPEEINEYLAKNPLMP